MGVDFLISLRAKELLEGLNSSNSYFLNASIYAFDKKPIEQKYHVVYTAYFGFDAIDFDKTIFFSGSTRLGKNYHHFTTHKDWIDYWDRPEHELVWAEKISLKSEYAKSDFIKTRLGGTFVSDRLLDRWTNFGISGFIVKKEPTLEFV